MLTAYKPQCEDLWFKQLMLSDEETMSYNHAYGGTIPFPKERWQEWYTRWVASSGNKRYYRYLKNDAGAFVGEMAYHYDEEKRIYMADVLIYAKYRGRGYGSQALKMLCAVANDRGLSSLSDEIAADNPSVSLFLRHGFSEVCRTEKTILLQKTL